jgi:transcriptional regulator GlxA family with amidase domain
LAGRRYLSPALGRRFDKGATNRGSDAKAKVRASDGRVLKVIELVSVMPGRSVGALARSLNLSASRLEHLFKQDTDASLHDHIIAVRARHAKRLLTTTELSIKEIASRLGYAHAPSFTRVFSAATGQTPREYRERAIRDLRSRGPSRTVARAAARRLPVRSRP